MNVSTAEAAQPRQVALLSLRAFFSFQAARDLNNTSGRGLWLREMDCAGEYTMRSK